MQADEIRRVVVIGAGTMGAGIAQVAAAAGCEVTLHDVDEAAVQRGIDQIAKNLDKGIEKGKVTAEDAAATRGRIRGATDLSSAVGDADCIIEAVPEKLDLKKKIFAAASAAAPKHAILGTNTSSLSIGQIAQAATDPTRVIGMHFFNPAHIMPLLEIVVSEATAPTVTQSVKHLAQRIGKKSIVVNDSPGFATSRLGVVLGLEAIRMLEAGVGTAEDIDAAMEIGYRHPMGPLRLTDLVGLDIRLSIAEHLYEELGEQFRPPALLRDMVAAGKLGKKTGQGFYRWD